MSNSIWHKSGLEVPATDNKAKISRGGDIIYWTPYGWSHPKSYNHHRIGCEWAYLEDIIAQADKAERLQKAVCFIRNIRGAGMSYQDMFLDAHEVAKTALDPEYKPVLCGRYDEEILDEIQQLIKGEIDG